MHDASRILTLHQPRTLLFGSGCAARCCSALQDAAAARPFVLTTPPTRALCEPLLRQLHRRAAKVETWDQVDHEPTTALLQMALSAAREARASCIVGVGGGSVLDVAKLVAALLDRSEDIHEIIGTDRLRGRSTPLVLLPTTAGTGSEVSPNAIVLDEGDRLKKGVISPHLVPDAAYVDPELTLSVPPDVTGATGLDALTHCIEAYVNRMAHPMIDLYALEGVRLIARSLRRAFDDGQDLQARSDLALASLFGGLCLGPVNTGAVHALAYPLGGEFGVPHGVSNAVLLPHVIEFNLPAAPDRYAAIAVALGAQAEGDPLETARAGVRVLRELAEYCGMASGLRTLGVPAGAVDRMAESAMTVTRLLDRNVRKVSLEDAREIYRRAL